MGRAFTAALLIFLCVSIAVADVPQIAWDDLIDSRAQSFEDPYADLTVDQVAELGTVVRARALLQDSDLADEERTQAEGRLRSAETALEQTGVDVDWLLGQRWVVAERREKAAIAVNPDVDGKMVVLGGFAIPAPPDSDGTPIAYLVPERGMCSHMPPPNPNQMIRVRLNGDWVPTMLHEPVRLTGRLTHSPSLQEFHIVDGPVRMRSSFSMDVTDVQTIKEFAARPEFRQ